MSLTSQANGEVTLTILQPMVALEGLALIVIAVSLFALRWPQGKASATVFALGLMPMALGALLMGFRDALQWYLPRLSGSPESWDGLAPLMLALWRLELVGLLLSAAAACFWALRRGSVLRR